MEELMEADEMVEEVVENPYLEISGEDEVRLAMYIVLIVYDNASSPLNMQWK